MSGKWVDTAEVTPSMGTEEQTAFCAGMADCRLIRLPGARLEVLMEEEGIRARALAEIRNFLAAQDN